jgi:hypothetical protein
VTLVALALTLLLGVLPVTVGRGGTSGPPAASGTAAGAPPAVQPQDTLAAGVPS